MDDIHPKMGREMKLNIGRTPATLIFCILFMIMFWVGCESDSAYKRDIRNRGSGSQSAWSDATGGRYNGNLPRDTP